MQASDLGYLIVIPARMASTRLPGKPLINLEGKTMIQRTYEQCAKVNGSDNVVVATDHQLIVDHCSKLGMNVLLTSMGALTGTDRVAEVAENYSCAFYVNVQGDEPMIDPNDIRTIVNKMLNGKFDIVAGYTSIDSASMYNSFDIPKIVMNVNDELLYMSRSPIPGSKDGKFLKSWRQVCVYAFSKKALAFYKGLGVKSVLEGIEDLELIRFVENGWRVQMVELSSTSISVDNVDDVRRVCEVLREKS